MRLLANVSWVQLSGYAASLLVFVAFFMKTMIPLRGRRHCEQHGVHHLRDRGPALSGVDSSLGLASIELYPAAPDAGADQQGPGSVSRRTLNGIVDPLYDPKDSEKRRCSLRKRHSRERDVPGSERLDPTGGRGGCAGRGKSDRRDRNIFSPGAANGYGNL